MSKIQFKRGLEADRLNQSPAFVPDAGEPIWVTDKNTLYIGDGSTEGGVPVSKGLDVLYTRILENPNAYGTPVGEWFGYASAISGNYGIVGAIYEDASPGTQIGKAYIFDVTTGSLLHTLDSPNATTNDEFGSSVAISGNYAIVGAWKIDGFSGKAYIYNVTTGALLHTLNNPDFNVTSSLDRFGYSVDISGNYAIVGAYVEYGGSPASAFSGVAYIFDVTTGDLLYTLDNPDYTPNASSDYFGDSVAISGNYAVVGAKNEEDAISPNENNSGKVYIYDISTFTSNLITTANYVINNPNAYDTPAGDRFGESVAISGNYIIASATLEGDATSPGSNSGKVYIYDISTFTSNLITTANYVINNPNAYDTPSGDQFGSSVAISGNYVVIGTPNEDDAGGTTSGKVYLYDIATFTTTTVTAPNYTLDNPNPFGTSQNDSFGLSVGISGNYIIAGAYLEEDATSPGGNSGKAYIFKTNGQDPTYTGAEIASFANPTATATRTVTEFTATASQTEFTGLSYEVGYVDVHYNGSQLESTEFTATNGTSITLTTAATAGAVVRVTAWKLAEFLSSGITTEEFTMTGGETSITVDYNVGAIRFLRSGTLQASADFTATNGTSISFSPAAFAGELITVEKLNQITDSLGSADIGVTVQAYDADTAKYDDVTANFTGTLQNGGSNVVVDSDIGVNVQAYDATILNSADIGTSVQAYNSDLTTFLGSFDLGYRNVPAVGTQTGSYSLTTADVGKYVQVGSGGSITIPDATFSEGDVVSVFNNTTGNITITCSITTAYIGGEDADKASVTLATRGVATVFFISGTVCVITGNVS